MKIIYVLGAGGFAKEVYNLITDIGTYKVMGFIDKDESENISIGHISIPVLSEEQFLKNKSPEGVCLAMGVGEPRLIKKIANRFKEYEFPNLVHPRAILKNSANVIGFGNIITANVVFTVGINVGNFNIFNLSCTVGHDVNIGDYNVINPAVNISGGVDIGNENLLGVSSTILQFKKISNNCVVGASSLVTKDVFDNETVIGIPAKKR